MLYRGQLRIESSRLSGWDYRTFAWYFVTICIKDHRNALGYVARDGIELTLAGQLAQDHLANLDKHYAEVLVDRFVVMPNHVHALIRINNAAAETLRSNVSTEVLDCRDPGSQRVFVPRLSPPKARSISAIIRSYKSGVTHAWHAAGLFHLAWKSRFHDRLVRSSASLEATRAYIEDNPRNWIYDPERHA